MAHHPILSEVSVSISCLLSLAPWGAATYAEATCALIRLFTSLAFSM